MQTAGLEHSTAESYKKMKENQLPNHPSNFAKATYS